MKKIYKEFLCLLCVGAIFSCAKEVDLSDETPVENPEEEVIPEGYSKVTFTASSEEVETRTALSGSNTVWSEGDQIKVFYSDADPVVLTIDPNDAGNSTGKFTGVAPNGKTPTYAVYPASIVSSVDGGTVSVTIPDSQPGTFSAGNIAVAKFNNTDRDFSFKNINAFLVFQLKEGSEVTKVEVTSVGGVALAGTVPVTFSGTNPIFGEPVSTESTISMTTSGAGTYYMSVVQPSANHTKGLKLTYYTGSEGNYVESGVYYLNKNLPIAANKIYTIGEVVTDRNYYVTVSGGGKHNGLDWTNAFSAAEMWKRLTLNAAQQLDPSDPGADPESKEAKIAAINGATFHMGAGTYDFGDDPTISFNEDAAVTITLKGGYPAAGGTRNIASNATNITGARAGTSGSYTGHHCLKLSGNMTVYLDGLRFIDGYNSLQFGGNLVCSGSNLTVSMTDCEVSNNLNDYSTSGGGGAGIYLDAANSFSATRVVISNNQCMHAPALYCRNTSMTLNNCQLNNNTASSWGGAIRIRVGNPTCTFNSCSFSGNSASGEGGCFVIDNGTSNFNSCTFTGNYCANNGGAIWVHRPSIVNISGGSFTGNYVSSSSGEGGAIRMNNKESASGTFALNIENCTFGGAGSGDPNYSGMDGGALSLQVGTTTITSCNFIGNYAFNESDQSDDKGYGGAIDCYDSAVMTISGGAFSGNVAWQGGAINCSSAGTVSLSGTTFKSNGNNNTLYGGAVRVNATMNFTDCTFGGNSDSDGNKASVGGALYIIAKTTTVDGCEFSHNVASTTTDNNGGGAIFVATNSSAGVTLTIKGTSKPTEFNNNSTASCGGAICGWHPSVDTKSNTLTIQDSCRFIGNHASKWAGAILYKNKGTMTVTDSRFTDNYADQDSGVFNGDNNNTTYNFNGVKFSGNHSDGDHGGVMWIARGMYNITSCIFKNNHTANDKRGGAVYAIDDGKVRFWKCQFNGNYSARGGAVCCADQSSRYPTLFFDCCSFDGNYIKDAWGTTIYAYKAKYFCMNNCSFANNTYVDKTSGHDGLKAAWIYLESIQNDVLFSNCTLIGRTWYKDSDGTLTGTYTYNGLIGLENGNTTKVTTYLINNLILLDNGGGSHFYPLRGYFGESERFENVVAHYLHYSKAFDNVNLTEDNSHTGNYHEHTRNGTESNTASWEGTYWKWNGTYSWNGTYDKISKSDFSTYLTTACQDFVNWLGDDMYKDCLGNDRGTSNWRPGAYQGI